MKEYHLFEIFQFGECLQIGDGRIAEVQCFQISELVRQSQDVPPGLAGTQVQILHLDIKTS